MTSEYPPHSGSCALVGPDFWYEIRWIIAIHKVSKQFRGINQTMGNMT
jgi:hypothetical protein